MHLSKTCMTCLEQIVVFIILEYPNEFIKALLTLSGFRCTFMSSVKWESYLFRIVDIWCSRWFTTAMKWSSTFFADSPDSLTESQRHGFVLLSLSPPFGPLDVKLVKKIRPAPRYTSKKAHRNDLSRAIAWIACWRPWCWWTARRETVFVDVYTQVWLPTPGAFQSWILIMKWKQQFFVVPKT